MQVKRSCWAVLSTLVSKAIPNFAWKVGRLISIIETLQVTLEEVVVEPEVKDIMKQLLSLSNFRSQHLSQSLFKKMRITGALLYAPPPRYRQNPSNSRNREGHGHEHDISYTGRHPIKICWRV